MKPLKKLRVEASLTRKTYGFAERKQQAQIKKAAEKLPHSRKMISWKVYYSD